MEFNQCPYTSIRNEFRNNRFSNLFLVQGKDAVDRD